MDHPKLNKPPLKEAVFQIKLSISNNEILAKLEEYRQSIKEHFPKQSAVVDFKGSLTSEGQKVISNETSFTTEGFKCESADGKTIVVARIDGFLYSRIGMSYTDWDNFYPEAKELYLKFKDYVKPENSIRYSLRFINEIFLAFDELDGYYSNLDFDNLGDSKVSNAMAQFRAESKQQNASCIIRELMSTKDGGLMVYVDIDVQATEGQIDSLDQTFQRLREYKNQMFYRIIKQKLYSKLQ